MGVVCFIICSIIYCWFTCLNVLFDFVWLWLVVCLVLVLFCCYLVVCWCCLLASGCLGSGFGCLVCYFVCGVYVGCLCLLVGLLVGFDYDLVWRICALVYLMICLLLVCLAVVLLEFCLFCFVWFSGFVI